MPKSTPKTKKAQYKFKPKVQVIAANQKALTHFMDERAIVKERERGASYEEIAEKRGIKPEEAKLMAQKAIDRWAGDLGETATQARALDLRRMDAYLHRLEALIFPEPYIDAGTGATIQPAPDLAAIKLALDIIERRAKFLGTDAADKLKERVTEMLERAYIGVPVNKQGEIDL